MSDANAGRVFWIYGLSGSGKSTLANLLQGDFCKADISCLIIDGDDLRAGLCKDLGFNREHRFENVRRAAELAKLISLQGTHVIVAMMTPHLEMRKSAREIVGDGKLYEIFLQCSSKACGARDVKGLYRRAAEGLLPNFYGVNQLFEDPVLADLVINTETLTINDSSRILLQFVLSKITSTLVTNVCAKGATDVFQDGLSIL